MEEGVAKGRRKDLTGGGLIRSMGGWVGLRELVETRVRLKGDERILGDSDFVMEVLRASEEEMESRYRLKAEGYDLDKLAGKAAHLFGLQGEELLRPGKYGKVVEGRDIVLLGGAGTWLECYGFGKADWDFAAGGELCDFAGREGYPRERITDGTEVETYEFMARP